MMIQPLNSKATSEIGIEAEEIKGSALQSMLSKFVSGGF